MAKSFEDQMREGDGIEYQPCVVTDFSKLNIKDGVINYKLYLQDGTFMPMTIKDSYKNRLFVSWVQIHDRYTNPPKDVA
jgi:hypothetical protein